MMVFELEKNMANKNCRNVLSIQALGFDSQGSEISNYSLGFGFNAM